ncbi:MAG: hypothetical protein JW726_13825, partial [Anaerolineales bacterium]|nr:hypothetical protein [Anaerolineales bacterium]
LFEVGCFLQDTPDLPLLGGQFYRKQFTLTLFLHELAKFFLIHIVHVYIPVLLFSYSFDLLPLYRAAKHLDSTAFYAA